MSVGDCNGDGYVECLCGGDFCVCSNRGTIECGGCWACDGPPECECGNAGDYCWTPCPIHDSAEGRGDG